jgi:dihydropyrimidine dehydrogenase (NAD+) subunit PreA
MSDSTDLTSPAKRLFPTHDLSLEVVGRRLPNPFILAAGPSTDELDPLQRAFEMGWGGAILKTTSAGAAVKIPPPYILGIADTSGTIHALGNTDLISVYPVEEVARRVKKLKKKFPKRLVAASIMGWNKTSWQTAAKTLVDAGVDWLECSFSCPQGNLGEEPGRMLAQNVDASRAVTRAVKRAARSTPVFIKITPLVTDIQAIAKAVCEEGADGITASNSIPSLVGIDLDTGRPIPDVEGVSTYSGLTGPAIKPISLRVIAEIAKVIDKPILATGGASTWQDTVEMMMAGAASVQFCTAVMLRGLGIIEDLMAGLSNYLREKGLDSPRSLIGQALPHIVEHSSLPIRNVKSIISEQLCIRCGLCVTSCQDGGHQAIFWGDGRLPMVDRKRCTGCGLCKVVCPVQDCISLEVV